tara:strand:- start:1399 stop:1593 length:195 start_codon:yes stop_codon:yes gene_type:complete
MTNKSDHPINLPAGIALAAAALAGAIVFTALALTDKDRAQARNERYRIEKEFEHKRWLIENKHK